MGYNTYSYLGAYIEMPTIEMKEKQTKRRCSDVNCSNHKKENMSEEIHFCSKCGTEIEEFEVQKNVSKTFRYYEFAEKNGLDPEKFAQVQEAGKFLISNRRFGSVKNWDDNEEIAQEFIWGDSRKCIVDFSKEAQDFLDKFKEAFNVELQVKFGIITYIM